MADWILVGEIRIVAVDVGTLTPRHTDGSPSPEGATIETFDAFRVV